MGALDVCSESACIESALVNVYDKLHSDIGRVVYSSTYDTKVVYIVTSLSPPWPPWEWMFCWLLRGNSPGKEVASAPMVALTHTEHFFPLLKIPWQEITPSILDQIPTCS